MIKLERVFKSFGHLQVLKSVNLEVKSGEVVVVLGPSGAGKSTMLRVVNGLETVDSGQVWVDGVPVHDKRTNINLLRQKIGFVFQGFNLLSRTHAIENVEMPLFYRGGFSHEEMIERAGKFLAMVGLSGRGTHHPNKLSGGEQQRVAIARALVNDPAILLADEPTGNLDSKNTSEIMNIFTYLNKEYNLSIVMVTHEPDVAEYSDRKVIFKDGLIIDEVIIKKLKKRKK